MSGAFIDRRQVATSRAYTVKSAQKNPTIRTVVPRPVLTILGGENEKLLAWIDAGDYFKLVTGKNNDENARRLCTVPTHLLSIPPPVVKKMGVGNRSILYWYVAAVNDDRLEIHVGNAGLKRQKSPNSNKKMERKRGIRMISRPLAVTTLHRYSYRKIPNQIRTSLPSACISILGLDAGDHLKWYKTRGRFRVVGTDPADRNSMRINSYAVTKDKHPSSFTVLLSRNASDCLYTGKGSRLQWYVAGDGMGRWEIKVMPIRPPK